MKSFFRSSKKNLLIAFVFFVGFFLFFFLRNHYFGPSYINLDGNFPAGTTFQISWDAGRGYNEIEKRSISIKESTLDVDFLLPQLPLKSVKVISNGQKVNLESGKIVILKSGTSIPFEIKSNVASAQIDPRKLESPRILLLLVQIMLAILIGWPAYELLVFKSRLGLNWKNFIKYIFFENQRWVFWAMFFIACAVFSFWLLGQWPGAATSDSFNQLIQTKTFEITNAFPYLSTLYLMALMQFHDSFAAVSVFQILATSALASYIFYFVYKNGIKFYLILPFYLLFIFSIPIGLLNITIWKDIPFSLLVVFWGFYLFYLGYRQKLGIKTNFSFKKIFILSLLFILVVLIRHNGYLYLLVLPLVIVWGRLMSKKTFITFAIVSLIFLIFFKFVIPAVFNIPRWSKVESNLAWKFHPMAALILSNKYISDNPTGDRAIVDKVIGLKNIEEYYDPNNGAPLSGTLNLQLNQSDINQFNKMFYQRIWQNLPLFLAERTRLFTTMLDSNYPNEALTWVNHYWSNPGIQSYLWDWNGGTGLYIKFNPVKKFFTIQQKIIAFISPIRPAIFNLLYPVIFLTIIFLLYRWVPLSARSSFFILAQLPFWFIFVISPLFRYLYFIYFYYFFAGPLLLLELNFKKPSRYVFYVTYAAFIVPFLIAGVLIIFRYCGGAVLLY
ncbi:MAG: hypothetical protein ABSE91_00235 [Patescibacteria group bacterium]